MASSTVPGISSGINGDIVLVRSCKPSVDRLIRTFKYPRRRRNQHLLSHRQLSLTATLSPSLPPLPPPHPSVYHTVPEHNMLYQSEIIILGATMVFLTLLLTSRFFLGFFPPLEKTAKQQNGPLALQYLVMLDSFLDPMMDSQDARSDAPNYAAIVYLASLGATLQLLLGIQSGLIPDTQLLVLLQIILIQKPSILLPQWSMTVFRGFKLFIIGVIIFHLGKELADSR
jgi:hypothetical protein